eukprot:9290115-Pyramimonas_sp.AAC.1
MPRIPPRTMYNGAGVFGALPLAPWHAGRGGITGRSLVLPSVPGSRGCLLYTSDAADDTPCVDL